MHKTPRTAVALSAVCMLAACAGPATSPQGSPETGASPPVSTISNDPALTAAADNVEPLLRTSFADSFAGLVLDHTDHTLIIYRRPVPDLDAAVRQRALAVRVVFRDARYSLRQMQDLATRVMNDAAYWRDRGVTVNGAGPASDGSGVEVMTSDGSSDEQKAMNQRYGAGAVKIVRGAAEPPIGRTPWRPSPSDVTTAK